MTVAGVSIPSSVEPAASSPVPDPPGSDPDQAAAPPRPAFAHHSEAELARILDFYAVAWQYEPHAFPILWNLDGDVVESFSPDFYLPDMDLYLELTTLRQKLVRKKNRKLRRLRELYPGLQVKLFYARDFRALLLKYGKLALAGSLSGTLGQVGPAGSDSGAGAAPAAAGRVPGPAFASGAVPTPHATPGSAAAVSLAAPAGPAAAPTRESPVPARAARR